MGGVAYGEGEEERVERQRHIFKRKLWTKRLIKWENAQSEMTCHLWFSPTFLYNTSELIFCASEMVLAMCK